MTSLICFNPQQTHLANAETYDPGDEISPASLAQESPRAADVDSLKSPNQAAASKGLLAVMWASSSLRHQIGSLLKKNYRNLPVVDAVTAQVKAETLSAAGLEVYFACAEYRTDANRTAANVVGAHGFWMDIDVGPGKQDTLKGYETLPEARKALAKFTQEAQLPSPTHVVSSGGGLHVYWTVDLFVDRQAWIDSAKKLKALTESLAFNADPTRTADIASVLRIPGTLNHKYSPPRLVALLEAAPAPLERDKLVGLIDKAHTSLCSSKNRSPVERPSSIRHEKGEFGPPDIGKLTSALKCIDPDCSESDWKLHLIAPLARAANEHPDLADELEDLAIRFSSGDLAGEPCAAWFTAGASNGLTGKQAFGPLWRRFSRDSSSGNRSSIGTIYYKARLAGWDDIEEFEQCETETIQPTLRRADPQSPRALPEAGNVPDSALVDQSCSIDETPPKEQKGSVAKSTVPPSSGEVAPTHHAYAADIIRRLTYEGWPPVHHEGALIVFDPKSKVWVPMEGGQPQRLIAETHDGKPGCRRRSDYNGIGQHVHDLVSNDSFFDNTPVGAACQDGFHRISGDQIVVEPLTPAHRQRILLNFSPRPEATPGFDKLLHETFKSSNEFEEQQQIALIQEIAGASMLGLMHRHHKVALFYDPYGRAGKGTFETILRNLVPAPFVTAVSPFDWANEYYLAKLVGARLNVVGELAEDTFIPAAIFKSVTGGDLLMARNPTQQPIKFKNEAAHIFLSNHLIQSKDQSEAFFTRWLIVEFPNSRLRAGLPLDPTLANRIVESELPGVAQWALEGARRLLKNNVFSQSSAHDRLMEKWRRGNSSLIECIHETCELDAAYQTRCSEFYRGYVSWCSENGRKPFSKARVRDLLEFNVTLNVRLASLDGHDLYRGMKMKASLFEL